MPAMLIDYLSDGSKEHDVEMVDAYLKMGESVHRIDGMFSRSVLSWAVKTGDIAIVRKVLAEKPDVNCADIDGRTPLMFAAFGDPEEGSFVDIFMVLLVQGASIGLCDKAGRNVIDYANASHKKNQKFVSYLRVLYTNGLRYAGDFEQWQKRLSMLK
jgi:hypothetical protein